MTQYKVPALELEQFGIKFYAAVIDSKLLFDITTISRRTEDPESGYQRNLMESRLRAIEKYLSKNNKGLIPNSIIINFDEDIVKFENQELIIPKDKKAWIIDGQHRVWGLHQSNLENYSVSVTVFQGLTLEEQIKMFITINKEQIGVPNSLYLDLLGKIHVDKADKKIYLERRARDLVERLKNEPNSPFYDEIFMVEREQDKLSLNFLVRKIINLINDKGVLKGFILEVQYKIIFNYFTAIKTVFIDQWNNKKNSLLTKTLGIGALFFVLEYMFNNLMALHGSAFTIEDLINDFELIKDFKFDKEGLHYGYGQVNEKKSADIIINLLQEKIEEKTGSRATIKL